MAEGFTFSEDGARRIVDAVRSFERDGGSPPAKRRRPGPSSGIVWQFVTPTAEQTGYWDGVLSLPDATLGNLADGAAVEIYAVSGTLRIGIPYHARLIGVNGDVSVWLVADQCSVIHKVVTGVVTSGGVTTQSYKQICWPSGEVVFAGCEVLTELDCEQPEPEPTSTGCCNSAALENDLTVTITNSSCGLIANPTSFDIQFKFGGPYLKFWEGGYKYAETTIAEFGGDYTHYCCTIEVAAWCDGTYSGNAQFAAIGKLRYWKVVNQSATALTYFDLIALEAAGDADTQVCTIGIFDSIIGSCLTGAGQSRSGTGLVFHLFDSFADCETSLGASPCCETDGFTIDMELES